MQWNDDICPSRRRGQRHGGRAHCRVRLLAVALAGLLGGPGCAIAHRDAKSGAVWLLGIGYLTMHATVAAGDKKAVVEGATMCGLSTGTWDGSKFFTVGCDRQQVVDVVDADTCVRLELPNDLKTIWLGSGPPEALETAEGCEEKP